MLSHRLFISLPLAVLVTAVLFMGHFKARAGERSSPSETILIDTMGNWSGRIRTRSLTAEIGDSTAASFAPEFTVSAWNGETFMRVHLDGQQSLSNSFTRTVSVRNDHSRTTLSGARVSHDLFYVDKRQLYDSTEFGLDSITRRTLEWEILLQERPTTNQLSYSIETDSLVFYYQPFLTPVERQRGTFRPDWAQDCYAVYHVAARGRMRYPDGIETDYRTGKAFTIERPRAWDVSGDTVWCQVRIDTVLSIMTITVPQSFLDKAIYPVTVDPTFGDNDEGGGDGWDTSIYPTSAAGNRDGNYQYTASSGDVLDSIAVYGKYAVTFNLAVYNASSTVPASFVDSTAQLSGTANAAWVKGAVVAGASLSGGTTYTICCGNASGGFRCSYDNATTGLSVATTGSLGGSWTESHTWDYRYAMYADYHNTGGGSAPLSARRRRILTGGK